MRHFSILFAFVLVTSLCATAASESFTVKYYGRRGLYRDIVTASTNGKYVLVLEWGRGSEVYKVLKPNGTWRSLAPYLADNITPLGVNNSGTVLLRETITTGDTTRTYRARLLTPGGVSTTVMSIDGSNMMTTYFLLNNDGHVAGVAYENSTRTPAGVWFFDGTSTRTRYNDVTNPVWTMEPSLNDNDDILFSTSPDEATSTYRLSKPDGTVNVISLPEVTEVYSAVINNRGNILFNGYLSSWLGPSRWTEIEGTASKYYNLYHLSPRGDALGEFVTIPSVADIGRGTGAVIISKRKKRRKLNCSVRNSVRLNLTQTYVVRSDGKILVQAEHLDRPGSGPAILTPERPGSALGYCPKSVSAELTGTCADYGSGVWIPDGTTCSGKAAIMGPDRAPLVNANVAVLNYDGRVVSRGRTDSSGKAIFTFTARQSDSEYRVIAPYGNSLVRGTVTRIYKYDTGP